MDRKPSPPRKRLQDLDLAPRPADRRELPRDRMRDGSLATALAWGLAAAVVAALFLYSAWERRQPPADSAPPAPTAPATPRNPGTP